MAEDLTEELYSEFIANLNLRFLTGLATNPAELGKNIQIMSHITEVLKRFVKTKTKWEMYEEGQARRLLWGIVSTPEDIAKNPQLKYREWLTEVQHPEINATLTYPGTPYRLSETPWSIRLRPPLVGEHNSEIFGQELGVTADEWKHLEAQGAV
jgi:crotonobetainyl-CoA:carnitine CoA-transferase CaiB-like acyl-CoA transferase